MKKIISAVISLFLVLSIFLTASAIVTLPTTIELCGIVDSDGADRTSWQTSAATYLSNIPDSIVNKRTAFDSTQLLTYLCNSDIFIVHTHGNSTVLKAVDSNGEVSYLYRSTIDGLYDGKLFDLDLAFLAACRTGATVSSGTNMVDAVYAKGASCVIGYKESVKTAANRIMVRAFSTALGGGYSIAESLAYADARVLAEYGSSGATDSRYIKGDTSTIFNPTMMMYSASDVLTSSSSDSSNNIHYFTNEDGVYGFFDFDKLTKEDYSATSIYSKNTQSSFEATAFAYLDSICLDSSTYSLQEFYYTPDTDMYIYIFNNMVCETETDDYVIIMLNHVGDLVSYSKPCEGAFASVTITEDALSGAEYRLRNHHALSDETIYNIVDKRIVWDGDTLSLCFSVETTSTDAFGCYSSIDDYIVPLS